MKSTRSGFTLIELMITVAVVGILAAIAYPAYTSHIRKGKRATAQAALMDIASKEQVYLLDRRAFLCAPIAAGCTTSLADLGFTVPQEIASAYTITVTTTASPPAFTATATPINAQANGGERVLWVKETGDRSPAATSGYWGY
jgi:type IV pilus assembly protein PilE